MKISAYIKRLSVATLVLGIAAGCATQPEKTTETCEGISPDVQNAIDQARSANTDAREMGADWRGARKIINQAEAAGAECDDARAMRLANEAEMMAEEAIDAYRAEQQEKMEEADQQEMKKERRYTVERGDTLWGIAGSDVGYNDPYQWPLIYRNNEEKIKDADLIYPGQDFMIEANPSASAVDAAISHAKNRGEWELGVTEESDLRYLSNN